MSVPCPSSVSGFPSGSVPIKRHVPEGTVGPGGKRSDSKFPFSSTVPIKNGLLILISVTYRRNIMESPISKFVNWQLSTGQLDHWTSYHIAAGLAIAKIAQWLGSSDLWAVLWVLIIGIAWEIFEYIIEDWRVYGSKKKWAWNTAADIIVEVGAAWWMVL